MAINTCAICRQGFISFVPSGCVPVCMRCTSEGRTTSRVRVTDKIYLAMVYATVLLIKIFG